MRCILHFKEHGDPARALAQELGSGCFPIGADLTCERDVEGLFEHAENAAGPIEILIANAGVWSPENVPLERMTLEQWNRTLASNLTSVFLCLREFFRGITRHGIPDPAAVLVGSTAAIFGEAGHADYAAAKAALVYGLARSSKNELARLAPRGRINVVCPGWTLTPMARSFAEDPAHPQGHANDPASQGRKTFRRRHGYTVLGFRSTFRTRDRPNPRGGRGDGRPCALHCGRS